MRRSRPISRLCRLAAAGLAATGLLGHGLAMLLVALLTPDPAAAGLAVSGYGEICAAAGPGAAANRESPGPAPGSDHGSNRLKPCPVCAAFAQGGPADLPGEVLLAGRYSAGVPTLPAREAAPRADRCFFASSRGPPNVA